jgi:hypothetical protein
MDCRQAQSEWALHVGNDPVETETLTMLERHTRSCPRCQRYQLALQQSQVVLQEARLVCEPRPRLWPRVSAVLRGMERRPQFAPFNIWIPTSVAAVACVLLLSVAIFEVDRHSPGGNGVVNVVLNRPQPRDLFQTDPAFKASQGTFPTAADFERWQTQEQQGFPLGAQPASNRRAPW